MRRVVNVLLVDADEPLVRKRADQPLMDGYEVEGVSAGDAARIKLGDGPDALVLCSAPETICLLRELRAGAIPRADSRLPMLVVGADDDSAGVRCYPAGADVALPSQSSPLLVAAGLDALARRTGGEERRQILRGGHPDRRLRRAHHRGGRPASRADTTGGVRSVANARESAAQDLHACSAHPRGVGLRPAGGRAVSDGGSPCPQFAAQAGAGGRRADGAIGARRRLEAHAMIPTTPPTAAAFGLLPDPSESSARRRPLSSVSARDGGAVSRDRDGWPQIRWLATGSAPRDTMIDAMSELFSNPSADWSSATTVCRSAYPPSYSDVYNRPKEMS